MRYGTDFSTQIKTCLPASTRAGLFFPPMQSHMKAAHFLWIVGGSGGVVAKSGLSLVTPWTAACQSSLTMGLSSRIISQIILEISPSSVQLFTQENLSFFVGIPWILPIWPHLACWIPSLVSSCLTERLLCVRGSPGGSNGQEPACEGSLGDPGSMSGSGRSPGEGNGNPPQHSCLEISMDWGAWCIHGAAKSQTQLSQTQLSD